MLLLSSYNEGIIKYIFIFIKDSALQHAYRDGRLEEVVLRHLGAEDGNTVIAKNIRLSFFALISLPPFSYFLTSVCFVFLRQGRWCRNGMTIHVFILNLMFGII